MGIQMATDPISLQQLRNASEDAQDLEHYINDDVPALIQTRLGGQKPNYVKFLADKNAEFQQFLLSSGYQDLGDYAAGVQIASRNQIFRKDGELYRAGAALDLPYTLTGDWATEGANFVAVGDAALRQEIAMPSGASMVGFQQDYPGAVVQTVERKLLGGRTSIEDFIEDIVYVEAPYGAAEVAAATLVDDAFQKAINAAVANGIGLHLKERVYKLSKRPTIPAGLTIIGEGPGRWKPTINPNIAEGVGKPDMKGSILLVVGTGERDLYATGITDCRTGGGVVANGNVINPGFDDAYRLTSFHNEDADPVTGRGASRRPFSAFFHLPRAVHGVYARGFRIMLSYDGIAGYHEQRMGLGDDWDVGLYVDNAEHNTLIDVYAVGYWRIAGRFLRNGACGDEAYAPQTSLEHNYFRNCTFTGMVGSLIRGADLHRVIGVGADYLEIPWASNHPFDPAALNGIFRQVGGTEQEFKFTGTQKSGDVVRLTGVTPNPVTIGLTTNSQITPGWLAGGLATMEDHNCVFSGLDHQSGVRATSPALGANRSLKPSAGKEISGWRIRGYRAPFSKIISQDDVAYHIHAANDTYLGPGFEIESKNAEGLGLGMRLISSTSEGLNTRVPHPAGQTFRIRIGTMRINPSDDCRPLSSAIPPRFPLGGGYMEANTITVDGLHMPIDEGMFLRPGIGERAGVKNPGGGPALVYDQALNQNRSYAPMRLDSDSMLDAGGVERISLSGGVNVINNLFLVRATPGGTPMMRVSATDWRPGTDNAVDLGTPTFRMKTIYAGTGSINTSDAREKTEVDGFTAAEIAAAKQLVLEIGIYRFLAMIQEKGSAARRHIGMTVQRAVEIMEAHGLDPMAYGFICYDKWSDHWEIIPAVTRFSDELDDKGEPIVIIEVPEQRRLVAEAGDRYGFRMDEFLAFCLRGLAESIKETDNALRAMDARISALEARP